MKDYKNLKLIASTSPHIRGSETTRSIMLDVVIAMLPALGFACWWFGLRALTVTAVSVVSCIVWEWLYRALLKKPCSVGDLSAVVTGMLLAFVCPVNIAYWQIAVGAFFAIVVTKQLFGGIGKNFINPALAGRAFMLASWASVMGSNWVDPAAGKVPLMGAVDAVTAATPLSYMKGDDIAASFKALTETYSLKEMVLGFTGGSMGEVCTVALLAGGVYLIGRKVINWHTPVAYVATVALLTVLFPRGGVDNIQWMLYSLTGGGLMLGAFFMATDYATSPVTKKGQLVYGIGCGLFTVFIRYFGAYNEGVCYSIMVMNCFTALIDKHTRPTRFGVVKNGKGAAK